MKAYNSTLTLTNFFRRLDHHVRELKAKMDNQITVMKEITSKMSNLASIEHRLEEAELRYGVYCR